MSNRENQRQSGSSSSTPYGTALLKADAILGCLAEDREPLGVAEIAHRTGLHKSTVFKLLETLGMLGYVERSGRQPTYRLGLRLIRLAHRAIEQMDLVRVAEPCLHRLNEATGETVHLGVVDRNLVVYVAKLESKQTVRMYSRVGNASPLYCTGLGKALLATFPEAQLEDYLRHTPLKRYTPNTLTTPDALAEELARIRTQGYAVDNCEHEADVRCVACALQDEGRVFGAISISAPRYRLDDRAVQEYLPLLLECCREVSSRLAMTV